MAEKKNKRPRHTHLVVPGGKKKEDKKEKDRLGRATPGRVSGRLTRVGAAKPPQPAPPKPAAPPPGDAPAPDVPESPTPAPAKAEEGLPPNAIRLPTKGRRPKKKKKLSAVKRKRRRRRIQLLAVALVVALGVMVYSSGIYLTIGTLVGDGWESLRIAARPGDGFPMSFAMIGLSEAEPMGDKGFVALGEREVAIVTSGGSELRRVQHSHMSPGVSAGDTRVVVYSRGGKAFSVEGRSKTLFSGETEMDIQFAEMSPGGWLAMATHSRHRAELAVYGPTYDTTDPIFLWRQSDEWPTMASFHKDNKGLLLGCVSASGGALGTSLYVLRTDREEPQAVIRAEGALLLDAVYLDNHDILAVYDSFTALFNQKGEELARYEYGHRRLMNADIHDGSTALLFGAPSQDTIHTVLLNQKLEPLFDVASEVSTGTSARVLADADGTFLLYGQQVAAFDRTGALAASRTVEQKTLTLTHGGAPLLLAVGLAEDLSPMLRPAQSAASGELARDFTQVSSAPQSGAEPAGQPQSPPPESLPASGDAGEAETSADEGAAADPDAETPPDEGEP